MCRHQTPARKGLAPAPATSLDRNTDREAVTLRTGPVDGVRPGFVVADDHGGARFVFDGVETADGS
ncbi:hypothetical protein [Haloarcula montana]|uniref:hypothetical protein n=1 Tax=Haloarcula montana TaxID=3111776 RepID=UPI002D79307E|nr:hypothetical protein [Haloarcula sp. GH36]